MLLVIALGFMSVLICAILLWFIVEAKYIFHLRKIPGPTVIPILGSALDCASTTVMLPKLMEWKKKYGNIYQVTFGCDHPNVVIADHGMLQFVLSSTKNLTKGSTYKYLHSWLGLGLLTNSGSLWKTHRKIIVPAFHFKILEQFIDVFDKNANIFVEKLKNELNSQSFDVYKYVTLMSLDIICETALGTNINAQNINDSKYVKSVKFMCNLLMDRVFNPLLQFDLTYKLTTSYKEEQKALKILHGVTKSVIRQRKQNMLNKSEDNAEEAFGIKRKLAFLDLLLQSNEGKINIISDKEIQEEVDTFMFEGHDTVSSETSFTLYNLSKYPQVQEKVIAEIKPICNSDPNYSFTYKDLQEMKYLEAVIKESLRFYPPVPFYTRTVTEEFEYEGVFYPKGTNLMIFAYGIGFDEQYFPEPEVFNPDRFLNYSLGNQYPYAYIPFSAGPRNCIGQKYALLEMKFTIAKILQHYEILPAIPDHKVLLSAETTLKSATGINIRIKKRNFVK